MGENERKAAASKLEVKLSMEPADLPPIPVRRVVESEWRCQCGLRSHGVAPSVVLIRIRVFCDICGDSAEVVSAKP